MTILYSYCFVNNNTDSTFVLTDSYRYGRGESWDEDHRIPQKLLPKTKYPYFGIQAQINFKMHVTYAVSVDGKPPAADAYSVTMYHDNSTSESPGARCETNGSAAEQGRYVSKVEWSSDGYHPNVTLDISSKT